MMAHSEEAAFIRDLARAKLVVRNKKIRELTDKGVLPTPVYQIIFDETRESIMRTKARQNHANNAKALAKIRRDRLDVYNDLIKDHPFEELEDESIEEKSQEE